MSIPRDGSWLDVMPFEDEANDATDRKMFVDIGGNIGHQCARLLAKHPSLAGRVVLQDLEETIRRAPEVNGVDFMVHDFFTKQPVKGKAYISLFMKVYYRLLNIFRCQILLPARDSP
jgi:demethylsterigmatocystin 6-O-methyltransferase